MSDNCSFMMQASKQIPFEKPNVLLGVRGLYILSNVIIASIYFYTKMQIDKKKGVRPLNANGLGGSAAYIAHRYDGYQVR